MARVASNARVVCSRNGSTGVAGNHERRTSAPRSPHPRRPCSMGLTNARAPFSRACRAPWISRREQVPCCSATGETISARSSGDRARAGRAPQELDAIIARGRHRILVNGHLHYRMIVDFESLTLINAGTLKRDNRSGFMELDLEADVVRFNGFDDALNVFEQAVYPFAGHSRRVFRDTRCFDGDWTPFPLFD